MILFPTRSVINPRRERENERERMREEDKERWNDRREDSKWRTVIVKKSVRQRESNRGRNIEC